MLPADRDPEPHPCRVSQRPQHRDLVIAKKDCRVGPVARITESTDSKHPVVDEVADEYRMPAVGRIRPQGLEKALEIAMDIPYDQGWQVFRGAHRRARKAGIGRC